MRRDVLAKATIVLLSIILLCACDAVPVIKYSLIKKDDKELTQKLGQISDSYYLAKSKIIIDKSSESKSKTSVKLKSKPGESVLTEEYMVTSKPIEFRDFKLGISPIGYAVKTNINIVKQDNTDLVQSIGVETVDNRKKIIEEIGGAVVTIVSLVGVLAAAPVKECSQYPLSMDIDPKDLAESELKFNCEGKKDQYGPITVRLGEIPLGSIKVEKLPIESKTSFYYYSSCRDATVIYKNLSKTVRINDPNYLQFVQLPFKGSVTMHSQCGVSVRTDNSRSDVDDIQLVEALIAQGKAIKEAIEAAKK